MPAKMSDFEAGQVCITWDPTNADALAGLPVDDEFRPLTKEKKALVLLETSHAFFGQFSKSQIGFLKYAYNGKHTLPDGCLVYFFQHVKGEHALVVRQCATARAAFALNDRPRNAHAMAAMGHTVLKATPAHATCSAWMFYVAVTTAVVLWKKR